MGQGALVCVKVKSKEEMLAYEKPVTSIKNETSLISTIEKKKEEPPQREEEEEEEEVYEEVPFAQMRYDPEKKLYTYDCPCGDLFEIYLDEMHDGENIAHCPSCSLKVKVLFTLDQLPPLS